MITEAEGNLLEADVDALVNTVNTVGVMGKGIALQFKRAFPAMFKDYAAVAKRGDLRLGRMHVWPTGLLDGPRFIINFPTKGHWRSQSQLEDIETGLDDLVSVIVGHGITSIAVPPLGCGHGGLDWREVEPMIVHKLGALPAVDVRVYAPVATPQAAAMPVGGPPPKMSPGRAALIEMLARYAEFAVEGATPIEAQKLMYFLQEAGESLGLRFSKYYYGPYADNLRHVLKDIEGHYLQGFGDGSQPVEFAETLRVLPGAEPQARAEIEAHPGTFERIERVLRLVSGFESPYSLELLATVHAVARDMGDHADEELVIKAVHEWSPRKQRMFPAEHIRTALTTLQHRGWIQEPVA